MTSPWRAAQRRGPGHRVWPATGRSPWAGPPAYWAPGWGRGARPARAWTGSCREPTPSRVGIPNGRRTAGCTGARTATSASTRGKRYSDFLGIVKLTCVGLELTMSQVLPTSPKGVLPTIKFFKDAVEDILTGRKTLEPRPRSLPWISRLEKFGQASFVHGPRFGAPTVFAAARIIDITVRPFDSVTPGDLRRIGYGWAGRSCEEFAEEYTRWFARELEKGYPVAWISFEVIGR